MVRREHRCETRPFRFSTCPPVLLGVLEATPPVPRLSILPRPSPHPASHQQQPAQLPDHRVPLGLPRPHPSWSPSLLPGPDVKLVLDKDCTTNEDHEPRITRHRTGPGLSVISYTHVCRNFDFCNDLSSTQPLWAPPPVTGARGRWGSQE